MKARLILLAWVLKRALVGVSFSHAFERHKNAAHNLDRAVREVLER